MSDAAFAEILRAAEAGEARFPVKNPSGLAGEAERLERAERLLFAEADAFDAHFAELTAIPETSPFAPRARRLKLLRTHRTALKKALAPDNPLTGPLYETLAAGPGPTMAKRRFAALLNTPALRGSASGLRRALSEKAYAVYKEERLWLKHVGPSRQTKGPGVLAKLWDNLPMVIIGVACVIALTVFAGSTGSGSRSGGIPFPVGLVGWGAVLLFRALRKNS